MADDTETIRLSVAEVRGLLPRRPPFQPAEARLFLELDRVAGVRRSVQEYSRLWGHTWKWARQILGAAPIAEATGEPRERVRERERPEESGTYPIRGRGRGRAQGEGAPPLLELDAPRFRTDPRAWARMLAPRYVPQGQAPSPEYLDAAHRFVLFYLEKIEAEADAAFPGEATPSQRAWIGKVRSLIFAFWTREYGKRPPSLGEIRRAVEAARDRASRLEADRRRHLEPVRTGPELDRFLAEARAAAGLPPRRPPKRTGTRPRVKPPAPSADTEGA